MRIFNFEMKPGRPYKPILPAENLPFLLVYILLAGGLLWPLRYYLDSNDTLIYISLARKYAAGNFHDAFNTYWSPLFSWLLVPFLKTGMDSLLAVKVLEICAGFFTLNVLLTWIGYSETYSWPQVFLKLSAVLLITTFVFNCGTPDLLFLGVLLKVADLLRMSSLFVQSNRTAIWCGFYGALLSYTKSPGALFFLSLFLLAHILFLVQGMNKKGAIKRFLSGLGVFILLTLPWLLVISNHEGHLSWNSSARYNYAISGPVLNPDVYAELQHPFYLGKLYPSPTLTALNAWENPNLVPVPAWSPFHSIAEWNHYKQMLWRNTRSIQSFNFGFDTGTFLLLGLMIAAFLNKNKLLLLLRKNSILILFPVLVTASYFLLFVMHRYIWINDAVILILAAAVASLIADRHKIAAILFSLSFLAVTGYQLVQDIKPNLNTGKSRWMIARSLAREHALSGTIVSFSTNCGTSNPSLAEKYAYSSQIANETNNYYAGTLDVTKCANVADELQKFNVKYIFAWDDAPDPLKYMQGRAKPFRKLTELGLNIYTFQ